jgi:hypothetical protein
MRRGQRGNQAPEKTTTMTYNILNSLVTEAVSLDREVNERSDRLKELKADLVAEARSREAELASTDSGGRRWTVRRQRRLHSPRHLPDADAQGEDR